MSELRRTWMRRVDNTYEVYNADTVDAEIASLKADIRQWLNEAQRQQKIATEACAEIAKLKEMLNEAKNSNLFCYWLLKLLNRDIR